MPVRDLKNCTVYIKDGGAGSAQKSLEIKIGEGNVTWDETYNREYVKDRGNLDKVRDGDQEPMSLKLDATFEYYTSAGLSSGAAPTPIDALKQLAQAADWVSASDDVCEPYCVDIVVDFEPGCGSGALGAERLTFPDFRVEKIGGDIKGGTLSFEGKCNAQAPVASRYTPAT